MVGRRVIAYVRVSTDDQEKHGVSREAQAATLDMFAKLRGHTIIETLTETASASTIDPEKRPRLDFALRLLRRGEADALLVTKLDRLTRSVRDLDELLTKHFAKGGLMTADGEIDTTSAGGQMVLGIITTVSQWERKAIGERTRTALEHKRDRGERTTRFARYGWALVDGGLVPHPAEQVVVTLARELRAAGWYYREIVDELARRGYRPRADRDAFFQLKKPRPKTDGSRFTVVSVQRMCRGLPRQPRPALAMAAA